MKKILVTMVMLISIGAYAQRQEGGLSLQARYGIMKGDGSVSSYASSASLGFSKMIGIKGYMFEGNVIFHDFKVPYEQINQEFSRQFYGINVFGGWSYGDVKPFYFNLKLGGFGGYELVNNGNKKNDEGLEFPMEVSTLSFGAVASPEVEVILSRQFTLSLAYSQYYNATSKWNKWQYSLELGVKYYF